MKPENYKAKGSVVHLYSRKFTDEFISPEIYKAKCSHFISHNLVDEVSSEAKGFIDFVAKVNYVLRFVWLWLAGIKAKVNYVSLVTCGYKESKRI